jgi:hypothetical protein
MGRASVQGATPEAACQEHVNAGWLKIHSREVVMYFKVYKGEVYFKQNPSAIAPGWRQIAQKSAAEVVPLAVV